MNRSLRPLLLMCLPVVLVLAVGLIVNKVRKSQKLTHLAVYPQPYVAMITLSQKSLTKAESKTYFEVTAHCKSGGGRGASYWLFRTQIISMDQRNPREVWNSENESAAYKVVDRSLALTGAGGYSSILPPQGLALYSWRIQRFSQKPKRSQFRIQAVGVPASFSENQKALRTFRFSGLGDQTYLGKAYYFEATAAQIAAARKQPGAIYFRKTLDLNAHDDAKHKFQ